MGTEQRIGKLWLKITNITTNCSKKYYKTQKTIVIRFVLVPWKDQNHAFDIGSIYLNSFDKFFGFWRVSVGYNRWHLRWRAAKQFFKFWFVFQTETAILAIVCFLSFNNFWLWCQFWKRNRKNLKLGFKNLLILEQLAIGLDVHFTICFLS